MKQIPEMYCKSLLKCWQKSKVMAPFCQWLILNTQDFVYPTVLIHFNNTLWWRIASNLNLSVPLEITQAGM